MVGGPADAGAWSSIRGGNIGKKDRAPAYYFRLFRVCAPAEGNAFDRARPRALVILEQSVRRRDTCSRLNDGPSKASCSNLLRQLTSIQVGLRVYREIEE